MKVIKNTSNFINELNWVTKTTNRHSVEDVSITIIKGTNKRDKRVNITLRNDVEQLICPSTYAVCAIHENRVYFRDVDSRTGFHINRKEGSATCNFSFTIKDSEIDMYRQFVGDYELCNDPVYNVYYIEKEEED